ncbi:MAG TPA: flagellar motor protein MotB, partial [Chromatiales bacterium]|nr:flagellar motor protein MotB [Chromatiales bacterium]
SVNEGKYRVLSETLGEVFQRTGGANEPINLTPPVKGGISYVGGAQSVALIDTPVKQGPGIDDPEILPTAAEQTADSELHAAWPGSSEKRRLGYIAGSIESVLSPFVDQGLVEVEQDGMRVTVTMRSKMLFTSGSARLSRDAIKALRDVSQLLKPIPNPIIVEGYTDNIPISTPFFPSNWELSAARAASVVHLFTRLGVKPERLAAVGYGEHHPLASNDTEDGRAKNRRVRLTILSDDLPQELWNASLVASETKDQSR